MAARHRKEDMTEINQPSPLDEAVAVAGAMTQASEKNSGVLYRNNQPVIEFAPLPRADGAVVFYVAVLATEEPTGVVIHDRSEGSLHSVTVVDDPTPTDPEQVVPVSSLRGVCLDAAYLRARVAAEQPHLLGRLAGLSDREINDELVEHAGQKFWDQADDVLDRAIETLVSTETTDDTSNESDTEEHS